VKHEQENRRTGEQVKLEQVKLEQVKLEQVSR
jgi:hypothetical protein